MKNTQEIIKYCLKEKAMKKKHIKLYEDGLEKETTEKQKNILKKWIYAATYEIYLLEDLIKFAEGD